MKSRYLTCIKSVTWHVQVIDVFLIVNNHTSFILFTALELPTSSHAAFLFLIKISSKGRSFERLKPTFELRAMCGSEGCKQNIIIKRHFMVMNCKTVASRVCGWATTWYKQRSTGKKIYSGSWNQKVMVLSVSKLFLWLWGCFSSWPVSVWHKFSRDQSKQVRGCSAVCHRDAQTWS